MVDVSKFKPKTVYVTYIAATPQQVWDALTQPEFTRQYFAGFAIDVEPRENGAFRMLYPDGRVHIAGRVIEWSPPRRFACTWVVEGMAEFRDLPECLVTYEIEPAGESVRLTMTEAHQWDVPDDLLSGGRAGWPAILSSLKSVLETGKPLRLKMEPPKEMMAAVERLKRHRPSS
jgi:uncharacterized protein YndB with AHSA1/START domain